MSDILCKNLTEKLHFESLLPIQQQVLPIVFDTIESARRRGFHRDCLIAAPTGSGKTLCYLLPIVQLSADGTAVNQQLQVSDHCAEQGSLSADRRRARAS
jgi:superfamily II DNA/RNA helicase